jgi:hypothetical protein
VRSKSGARKEGETVNRITGMSEEDVREFISARLAARPDLRVIRVSVTSYPGESAATVWLGQDPPPEMRRYAYELEDELANLGVSCNILVRGDREGRFGGVDTLHTKKGSFPYRYLRADPAGDEDVVYFFSLYGGEKTYRYRLSLSRTLASMLRLRNQFDEDKILQVYRDQIRSKVDQEGPKTKKIENIMLDSSHRHLFGLD